MDTKRNAATAEEITTLVQGLKFIKSVADLLMEIETLNEELAKIIPKITGTEWKRAKLSLLRSAKSKLELIIEKSVQVLVLKSHSLKLSEYPPELIKPMIRAQQTLALLNKYVKVRSLLKLVD
jgi:Holliday junction resolvasome RuvABC endonuclease subunit